MKKEIIIIDNPLSKHSNTIRSNTTRIKTAKRTAFCR